VLDVAALDGPVEEDPQYDKHVVVGAFRGDPREAALQFLVRQLRELAFERYAAEEPLVVVSRPRAAALALLRQEEVDRLRVGDALRPDAAESELGEDRARLVARLGEGDGRVAADGDSPVLLLDQEGLGAALADADGECARLERRIPEIRLPIRGGLLAPKAGL
jgi:hypothetical protein